jgi:predicted Rossmann fold flavoprotein
MTKQKHFIIIGGGAAGFFSAINTAEKQPNLKITILEASPRVLQKVKVSGGGRCNLTNACFIPKDLTAYYPRGQKELLGPFHQFMTGDTMEWFENRDVPLKIEADNRVFPESNSSQDIIDCFTENAKKNAVELLTNHRVIAISKINNQFKITTSNKEFLADYVLVATGSSPKVFEIIKTLNHTIISLVPSLFTFNIKDQRISEIPGVSVSNAHIKILGTKLDSQGPLLITHWGMSGPAILKLSAFGALDLHQKKYEFQMSINWLSKNQDDILEKLKQLKILHAKKQVVLRSVFEEIPKRLWEKLVLFSEISLTTKWADLNKNQLQKLTKQLTNSEFSVHGKSTFKDEFVTAGGVDLKEINFKRFESKIHDNLFFAGEVLNIDAITGGFNFQNAWTGAWMVANAIGN